MPQVPQVAFPDRSRLDQQANQPDARIDSVRSPLLRTRLRLLRLRASLRESKVPKSASCASNQVGPDEKSTPDPAYKAPSQVQVWRAHWRETGSTTCLQPSIPLDYGSGFSPYRQVGQIQCVER